MPNCCRRIDPLVTPFVDGELADADRRAVDEHLRACPPCHSRVAAERAVRELIRAREPALAQGRRARRAARQVLRGLRAARRRRRRRRAAASARRRAAAARGSRRSRSPPRSSLVVGGAFVYQATDQSSRVLAAELTADHVKCFAMNGVLGTHAGAGGRRELDGVAASAGACSCRKHPARAGLELVGARRACTAKGEIAHIMYRHDGQPVSLFMLPQDGAARGARRGARPRGARSGASATARSCSSRASRAHDVERMAVVRSGVAALDVES